MVKLKIELRDIGAKRVVVVHRDLTLASLHGVIQSLFGWEGCHLWMFSDKSGRIWEPKCDASFFSDEQLDPAGACVADILPNVGDHVEYEYDFGDSWRHRITRMADPKEDAKYACVKTEGPDGEEDSRFSFADEGESFKEHVPSLEELNRRLPPEKSLKHRAPEKRRIVSRLKHRRGASPTVKDILGTMSEETIRGASACADIPAGILRDELVDRAAEHYVSHIDYYVQMLVMGLEDFHYEPFVQAAMNGMSSIDGTDLNECSIFETCALTHVESAGVRKVRLTVADEVRDAWQRNCMSWGSLHERWNKIHSFAKAAVRLYGGVSFREFASILVIYGEKGDVADVQMSDALTIRSTSPYAPYFIEGGFIFLKHFGYLDDYRRFCTVRDRFPRWRPSGGTEFLDYAEDFFFEHTPSREAFVRFLMITFGNSRELSEDLADDIQRDIADGESPDDVAEDFRADFSNAAEAERKIEEIADLLRKVRSEMRLADYNGNTFGELSQKGAVASTVSKVERTAPKVGRNDPCPCGSGLKYKKCCGGHG